jgi:hypothetical protein
LLQRDREQILLIASSMNNALDGKLRHAVSAEAMSSTTRLSTIRTSGCGPLCALSANEHSSQPYAQRRLHSGGNELEGP